MSSSSTSTPTPSHDCPVCCKRVAPRSDDPKVIEKALEHHTKAVHTEKPEEPLIWPGSGRPVVCEDGCWGGCGRVIYDSYEFTSGEETFCGMTQPKIISIEEAEELDIKAMCGSQRCVWG